MSVEELGISSRRQNTNALEQLQVIFRKTEKISIVGITFAFRPTEKKPPLTLFASWTHTDPHCLRFAGDPKSIRSLRERMPGRHQLLKRKFILKLA